MNWLCTIQLQNDLKERRRAQEIERGRGSTLKDEIRSKPDYSLSLFHFHLQTNIKTSFHSFIYLSFRLRTLACTAYRVPLISIYNWRENRLFAMSNWISKFDLDTECHESVNHLSFFFCFSSTIAFMTLPCFSMKKSSLLLLKLY